MLKSDSPTSIVSQPLFQLHEQGQDYLVRSIPWNDVARQDEYQRLRAEVFVRQLGWDVPVDSQGRERDRYDQEMGSTISVYCVYGLASSGVEYLLAGIRVFQLRDWRDSMITNEFHAAGMIPEHVLQLLRDHYSCINLLELTRFCVQRGRWYYPADTPERFNNQIARDLAYAAVFAQAQNSGRGNALALVDFGYLQVMRRAHFMLNEIFSWQDPCHGRFVLVVIDLWGTIRSIRAAGDFIRAQRMLALCIGKINDLLLVQDALVV